MWRRCCIPGRRQVIVRLMNVVLDELKTRLLLTAVAGFVGPAGWAAPDTNASPMPVPAAAGVVHPTEVGRY